MKSAVLYCNFCLYIRVFLDTMGMNDLDKFRDSELGEL